MLDKFFLKYEGMKEGWNWRTHPMKKLSSKSPVLLGLTLFLLLEVSK